MEERDLANTFSDLALEAKVAELQATIISWAKANRLWEDCGFKTFAEHVNAEPKPPTVVTLLWFEGPLYNVLSEYEDEHLYEEFQTLITTLGFHFELQDRVTGYFYAIDPELAAAFDSYFHWQWVCSLIQPDCADVYHELYGHFADRPDDLLKLTWREFEILLFRIFQSQGFQAELGLGQSDGGVDVRLLQRDPIGDVMTLVQAKRYAPGRKIDLQAVAALHGIATVEGAQRSLFVTTSSYLPVAKSFAARTSGALKLAASADIARWCEMAAQGIIADKSSLISEASVTKLLVDVSRRPDARIVRASSGYNMILNDFSLVVKETKYAALLMALPKKTTSDDGYGQSGFEVPRLDASAVAFCKADTVWRAVRGNDNHRCSYWDGHKLYVPWDGQPVYFDYRD